MLNSWSFHELSLIFYLITPLLSSAMIVFNQFFWHCFAVQRNKRKDSSKELPEVFRVCQQLMYKG